MNNGFTRLDTKDGLTLFRCDVFAATGIVRHAFSTRLGGVSASKQLNLGMHTTDDKTLVMENYRRFCNAAKVELSHLVLSEQVHSANLAIVGRNDCGMGLTRPTRLTETDGLITAEPGVALATFYADCTPILLLDPVKRVIASVHSGWRGTLARIGRQAAAKMCAHFGCCPTDILAAIGPSIQQCCFEVGEDVRDLFINEFGSGIEPLIVQKGEKFYIDTQSINAAQLQEEGLLPEHIDSIGMCTMCNTGLFFSHRGDSASTGRMCAVIELTE